MLQEIDNFFTAPPIANDVIRENKVALLDADYLKYIVTYNIWKNAQQTGQFEEPQFEVQRLIGNLFQKIQDPIIFCFSGKSSETFRNMVSFEKEYKGNRRGKPDAYEYERKIDDMYFVPKYISENYNFLLYSDLEADDIVSSLQDKENTYIISKDKDLKQVPGHHFDMKAGKIFFISEEEAMFTLCLQLLTGDSTDNIPGVPGLGPVKASNVLKDVPVKQMIAAVLYEYQKALGLFKGTDMFNEMWMLIKTRENRGNYFREKYREAFALKDFLITQLK